MLFRLYRLAFKMNKQILWVFALFFAFSGCGQKGALYMEVYEPPAEKRAKEAALKRAKAAQQTDDESDDQAVGAIN